MLCTQLFLMLSTVVCLPTGYMIHTHLFNLHQLCGTFSSYFKISSAQLKKWQSTGSYWPCLKGHLECSCYTQAQRNLWAGLSSTTFLFPKMVHVWDNKHYQESNTPVPKLTWNSLASLPLHFFHTTLWHRLFFVSLYLFVSCIFDRGI